jgi:hypothetical protein
VGWVDPWGLAGCPLNRARELANQIPRELAGIFKCVEFAKKLKEAIIKDGLHAETIELRSDTGLIYSDAAKKPISENGYHIGIKVGDHVFDNLNPRGIQIGEWMDDLGVGFPGMRPPEVKPF